MNISFTTKNSGGSSRQCKIIEKLSDTLYSVKDKRGAILSAESNGSFRKGEWVTVRNGIITGKTKKAKSINHYNV